MRTARIRVSAALLATVSAVAATSVQAQQTGAPQGSPDNGAPGTIPDIVVTANKRAQDINSVGAAITASTGEQLAEKGVTNVSDLTKIEPSLQFSQSQSGTPVYTLRGVGYFEQSLSATPAVSIYQDEVAYPYPVMARGALLDTERVEILKGPQGTLYGQNATGGAVNFIAAKPTDSFHAGVDVSYGRFNDALGSAFISGPLSSTLSARVAGSIELAGPWQRSVTDDRKLGSKDTQVGRLLLAWKPSSDFTATLNLNGWRDRSDTQAGQLEGFRIQAPANVASGNVSDPAFYIPAQPGSAAFNAYPAPIQAIFSNPLATDNARQADWLIGTHPHNHEDYYQASLRLDYQLSGAIGLTSLTSYQHFRERNLVDEAGVSAPAQSVTIRGRVTSFSQELRLHGDMGRFNWLVGANYERDKSYENDNYDPFISTASYAPVALGLPPFLQFGALNTDLAKTYSAFANADFRILDTVSLHGGIRYTKSDQSLSGCSYSFAPSVNIIQQVVGAELAGLYGGTSGPAVLGQCITLGPPPNFVPGLQRNTLNQHNVPWRVGIDWKPADRTLLYVSVSKGYKAGSSPALGASQYYQLTPVTQESLLSYEGGVKIDLFDRVVHFDASVFHYDYSNKQELGRIQDPVYSSLQALLNIPKSRENGVEAALTVRPTEGLNLNAAITYLDSKVTSHFLAFGPYPLGPTDRIDFYGSRFPYTPKWSAQYGARYEWPVRDDLHAYVGADGSWQSRAITAFGAEEARADGAPLLELKSYAVLNLTAGIRSSRGWRVEAWGRNVTNTYYWNTVNYISDTTVRLAGLPVTYGLRFSFQY